MSAVEPVPVALYARLSPVRPHAEGDYVSAVIARVEEHGRAVVETFVDRTEKSIRPDLPEIARLRTELRQQPAVRTWRELWLGQLDELPLRVSQLPDLLGELRAGGVELKVLGAGTALELDSAFAADRLQLDGLARIVGPFVAGRRAEAGRLGAIDRRHTPAAPALRRISPSRLINPLELRQLWERPHNGRMLSQRGILAVLRRRGCNATAGDIARALADLRASGELHEDIRARNVERFGEPSRGGRPAVAVEADERQLIILLEAGATFEELRTAPIWGRRKRVSRYRVEQAVKKVEGRYEASAREASIERRRAERHEREQRP